MKKVIDGKIYNTKTATCIASWDNGYYGGDFNRCSEDLYQTKKGVYFIYGEGGPRSRYSESCGNGTSCGEDSRTVDRQEAYEWCEEMQRVDAIEEHFSDMVEEG